MESGKTKEKTTDPAKRKNEPRQPPEKEGWRKPGEVFLPARFPDRIPGKGIFRKSREGGTGDGGPGGRGSRRKTGAGKFCRNREAKLQENSGTRKPGGSAAGRPFASCPSRRGGSRPAGLKARPGSRCRAGGFTRCVRFRRAGTGDWSCRRRRPDRTYRGGKTDADGSCRKKPEYPGL